jgi:hypothetical protein
MIHLEDVYTLIAKVYKLKHSVHNDKRPEHQKELAHAVLNDVLFALDEVKAKL